MAFDNNPWPSLDPTGSGAPPSQPQISPYAAGLVQALADCGLPGVQDALSLATRLGLAAALEAYPGAAPSGDSPPSSSPTSPDADADEWTLPNGQVARQYDAIQGDNVVYHHGDLSGTPGVFVDDFTNPDQLQTVFTPTSADPLDHGFLPSPEVKPSGSLYYDKVVWRDGDHQAVLRVDAQGNLVKAFGQGGGAKDRPAQSKQSGRRCLGGNYTIGPSSHGAEFRSASDYDQIQRTVGREGSG